MFPYRADNASYLAPEGSRAGTSHSPQRALVCESVVETDILRRHSQGGPPYRRASRFLGLSPDVRDMVYEEALVFEPARTLYREHDPSAQHFNPVVAIPDRALVGVPRLKHLPPLQLTPQILQVNRQVYEEARAVLYGRNYFRAEWAVQNPLSLFESKILGIGHWIQQIGYANAEKVRLLNYRLKYTEDNELMMAICNDFFISVLSSVSDLKGLQCFSISGSLRDFHWGHSTDKRVRSALSTHPLLKRFLRIDFFVRPLIHCECTIPETRIRLLSGDRRWPERKRGLEPLLESEKGLYEPGAYDIVPGNFVVEEKMM